MIEGDADPVGPEHADPMVAAVIAGRPGASGRLEAEVTAAWNQQRTDEVDAVLDSLAAAAGSSAAAAELLTALTLRLHLARPSLRKLLFAPDDLSEAEQLTALSMLKGINGFERRSKYRTWLFTVARNEAAMLLRRKQRRAGEVEFDEATDSDPFVASMSSVIITGEEVRRAIDELPEPYRAAVVLRELDGLSYAEVAARLDRNLDTVKTQIHRGRQLAQAVLAERLALRSGS